LFDFTRSLGVLWPSLERLIVVSSLPDNPENVTFSRTLSIVEPDNKLVILGSVAGVLATSVLLVALYAPTLHPQASLAPRRRRRALPAWLARPRCYAATCS
jgi:hypothetical protein